MFNIYIYIYKEREMYICIHIIYIYIYTEREIEIDKETERVRLDKGALGLRGLCQFGFWLPEPSSGRQSKVREFREGVFEDVVFDNDSYVTPC